MAVVVVVVVFQHDFDAAKIVGDRFEKALPLDRHSSLPRPPFGRRSRRRDSFHSRIRRSIKLIERDKAEDEQKEGIGPKGRADINLTATSRTAERRLSQFITRMGLGGGLRRAFELFDDAEKAEEVFFAC